MQTGAITGYIDVAQLTLYAFWIFFAGLVFYLRSEDKREGYPLQSGRNDRIVVQGFPPIPRPKTFILPHGRGTRTAPRLEQPSEAGNATPVGLWPGAPLQPDGDPMRDGVGPAAYAQRSDRPDLTIEGEPRIVPLRVATDHYLDPDGWDPRGMLVVGTDRQVAGTISDIWVDRSEVIIRYLEVAVSVAGATTRHVLLPMNLAVVSGRKRIVYANSVQARHFANAPGTASPDEVTLREEDRITAYFASGYLYATPGRAEPLL
jgi:photosynthetic reaction center H subunit